MIHHDRYDDEEFEINEAVDDIIEMVADYANKNHICPTVACELLAMAAAKSRIYTHLDESHNEEDNAGGNGR